MGVEAAEKACGPKGGGGEGQEEGDHGEEQFEAAGIHGREFSAGNGEGKQALVLMGSWLVAGGG